MKVACWGCGKLKTLPDLWSSGWRSPSRPWAWTQVRVFHTQTSQWVTAHFCSIPQAKYFIENDLERVLGVLIVEHPGRESQRIGYRLCWCQATARIELHTWHRGLQQLASYCSFEHLIAKYKIVTIEFGQTMSGYPGSPTNVPDDTRQPAYQIYRRLYLAASGSQGTEQEANLEGNIKTGGMRL